jgi:hypothetical protein
MVEHLERMTDHLGVQLNVFNQLTDAMVAIADRMPLKELGQVVHDAKRKDPIRGNKFVDVGYATDINSKRDAEFGGVSKPQGLDRSDQPIFKKAMTAMTKMCDLACQEELRGKVFVDKERNALFAGKNNPGNRIEALRVALTNAGHLVACHADDHNDVLENFRGVVNYSKWLFIGEEWWRLSIIGYSRKSIAGCIRRRDLYMPLVERITLYYQQMPQERKLISKDLLDFSLVQLDQHAKRLKPHTNKCVYYSIYVHCLLKLTTKLHLSRWHVLALITNTIVSESPEFFYQATMLILKSSESSITRYRTLGPIDLALEFYETIFDEKRRRTKAGIPTPGQRHQPHYNCRQGKDVVKQSVENVFQLYQAFEHIDPRLASDPHFYGKVVAFLEASYHETGVFGAGSLTGQHLIHIGVLCGFFPKGMLKHGEIGATTNSYKYLRRWEGLSDYMEDTRQLLACLSTTLGLPHILVENIICKFGQDQIEQPPMPKHVPTPPLPGMTNARPSSNMSSPSKKSRKDRCIDADNERIWKKRKNPYKDSVYRGQSLFYLDEQEKLVKVTKFGPSFTEPLSSRCLEFERESMPQVFVSPVAYSFWEKKVKGRRVIPMTSSTRTYLKKVTEAVDNAIQEQPDVSTKKRKTRAKTATRDKRTVVLGDDPVLLNKKRRTAKVHNYREEDPDGDVQASTLSREQESAAKTIMEANTNPQVASVEVHADDNRDEIDNDGDNDNDNDNDNDDEDYAHSGGSDEEYKDDDNSNANDDNEDYYAHSGRTEEVRISVEDQFVIDNQPPAQVHIEDQPRRPTLIRLRGCRESVKRVCSLSDRLDSCRETAAALAKIINPELVRSVPAECRVHASIKMMAMKALAIPRFDKKFLQFGERIHKPCIGRCKNMVTASLLLTPDGTPWLPPSRIGHAFITAFFPRSVVMQDGKRYHQNRVLASRYLFMAAVLTGKVNSLDDLLGSKHRYGNHHGLAVVVDVDACRKEGPPKDGPPLAAIARQSDGSWAFSFVDVNGLSVGKVLSITSTQ